MKTNNVWQTGGALWFVLPLLSLGVVDANPEVSAEELNEKTSVFATNLGIIVLAVIAVYWILAIPGCIFIYVKYVRSTSPARDKRGVNLKVKMRKKRGSRNDEYEDEISSHAAKILFVSPNLSNSMVLFTGRMADVLVAAGHNVTFLIPELRASNQLNGTKLARVVRMKNLGDHFDRVLENYGDLFVSFRSTFWRRRDELVETGKVCENILKRFDELRPLRDEKFELAIADHVDFCDIGLIHALDIPLHIWTTTGPIMDTNAWAIGIPPEVSYVPNAWEGTFGPAMNFFERAFNLWHVYVDRLIYVERTRALTQLFRRYVNRDFPDVVEVAGRSSLLFVNADEFLEPARPLPPKVVHIGGIGLQTPDPLPSELSELVDDPNSFGFVFFSLGTSVSTLSIAPRFKSAIIRAFSQLPAFQFVVKVDAEDREFFELAADVKNVHLLGWAPQRSLLAHPKARLFITHGGYNSILESTISGLPMLLLPLFFDQHRNAKIVEYRRVGRVLKPADVTTERLKAEVEILLNDENYALNARRLSKLFHEKPNQPDETAVKWVEFVLQNGRLPELTPELINLNWISYNQLDLLGCLVLSLVVAVVLVQKMKIKTN